jgi:thiol:disulfide interchange protein DsbD
MKYISSFILLLLISSASFSQIVNPVHWTWRAEQVSGDEYKVTFTALIDKPWHTYGMYIQEGGPVKTSFTYEKNPDVELIGKMTESGPKVKEGVDDVFGVNVKLFEEKAVFEQRVKLKNSTTLKGSFEFMTCDDKSCLPPDTKKFEVVITKADAKKKALTEPEPSQKTVAPVSGQSSAPADTTQPAAQTAASQAGTSGLSPYYQHFFDKTRFATPVNDCGQKEEPLTTWLAFILGFGGGLLALLTPCVFPMIPLTVSFFTKRGENKTKGKFESIFYGFSIMLIFFLLAMPFLLFNLSSNTLNAISTNMWLNLFFFVIFLVFAFSFFGYYEIALPSSFATRVDNASNVGGLVGIFLMALTLVVVSFSCTGPILGTLLGSMATTPNGKLNLVVGMTSFGLAMGLPFTLFALFPNLLKSLPKSGGWMDSVKKVLGFVELILAMKFLSNADLVGHWGVIKREVFLAVWAVLSLALFFYLIGILKFKSEGPANTKSPIRLGIAVFVLAFTVYSIYGVAGNDLPLLSGFPPPNYYSIFAKKTQCPDDLSCFHDYDEAVEYARKVNKPIFIDFTGYNCANCRRMEENIWKDQSVYLRLSQKYVVVSLYVDDYQRRLPEPQVYVSPVNGEQRASYGTKWSDFQAICFNTNTQPQYALISPDEKLLDPTWKGYDPDPKKFQDFLDCGLDAFGKLQGK